MIEIAGGIILAYVVMTVFGGVAGFGLFIWGAVAEEKAAQKKKAQ